MFDIEINLDNHRVTYIEEVIQYPVLTPNSIITGRETTALEENPKDEDKSDWKKRRYIRRWKDSA